MPLRLAAQRPRTAGPRPLTASPSAINIPQIATTPVALQRAQHDAQVATVADRRRTSDSVKCVRKERVAWMALALAQRGVSTLIWPHMAVHTFSIPPARVGQGAAALPNELTAQRRLACEDQSTRHQTAYTTSGFDAEILLHPFRVCSARNHMAFKAEVVHTQAQPQRHHMWPRCHTSSSKPFLRDDG